MHFAKQLPWLRITSVNKHAPSIPKVILYYGFTPLEDPEAVKLWQKQLCESLNLKGRIIISKHGINGTVGGDMADVKKYVKMTRQYQGFKKIVFKWSDGTGSDFPRLQVRVRKELVGFGNPDRIVPSDDAERFKYPPATPVFGI